MPSTYIHLVRHGEVHNPKKILYGRLPRFSLSTNGVRQARETGRYLSSKPLAAIYSSPLLRARQTAKEILAFQPQGKIHISSQLNEVCTAYEGLPGDQVDRKNGDIYTGVAACYEQPADVFGRVQTFLNRMHKQFTGKHLVAVSHGDVITFTVLWALGWDLIPKHKTQLRQAGYPAAYPAHASVTTLVFKGASETERPTVAYTQPWTAL